MNSKIIVISLFTASALLLLIIFILNLKGGAPKKDSVDIASPVCGQRGELLEGEVDKCCEGLIPMTVSVRDSEDMLECR